MAFTVADAIRTWDTAGPANNLRQGYALGVQRAQAQDAAIRDRQRLEFEAVRLAEQQKTSDFNRVFDQLKFGEEQKQFQQQQRLREQVYGRQVQNDRFDQGMISQGINPNTGARNSDMDAALYPPGYGPQAGSSTTLPPIPESTEGSATLPPVPEDVDMAAPVRSTDGLPPLPDGPVEESEGLLLPGNEITAPPGGEVLNVLTDMPGNPGMVADTTLVEGAPPTAGVSFGNLPVIAANMAVEAPAPVSEMDRILEGLRGRQSELLTAAEVAAGESRGAMQEAEVAKSNAKSRQLPVQQRQAWMSYAAEKGKESGSLNATATRLARDLVTAQDEEKELAARRPVVEAISTLRGVLPEDQLREVEASALAKKPSAVATQKLAELENYAAYRQANELSYKSKGVETARAVGRLYAKMNTPEFVTSRQADAENKMAEAELSKLDQELARTESKRGKELIEAKQKALTEEAAKMFPAGRLYRGLVSEFDAARKADVKAEAKKAETKEQLFMRTREEERRAERGGGAQAPTPAASASEKPKLESLFTQWAAKLPTRIPSPTDGIPGVPARQAASGIPGVPAFSR